MLVCVWAMSGGGLEPRGLGQDAPGSTAQAPPTPPAEEVQPRGMYLRNEKGELVYVPDVSYEQFERLLKIERNLVNPQRPAVVITNLEIDATASESRVAADVTVQLEGRGAEGGDANDWFQVPLRLGDTFLVSPPTFDGPGEHFLTFDGPDNGYVCWLQRGSGSALHTVKLALAIPVERVGNETRLALSLPAPLASRLALKVPEEAAEGTVRDGAGAAGRPLTFETTPEGQGQFVVRGVRGDVAFTWHAQQAVEQRAEVRLDVLGAVRLTADERLQEVRSEGTFVVRGVGCVVDTFQVRLPPGLRFRESPEPGYEVRLLPAEGNAGASGQLVEVRLDRPMAGEVSIRLLAEVPAAGEDTAWPLNVTQLVEQSTEFEPARFEFLGAIRHRGQVDVIVQGDWSLEDREDPDLPRVDPGPVVAAPQATVARYRYYNQQRPLRFTIRQKATRIAVEPTYDVFIDAHQARLRARLVCRTSGSRAAPLAIRLPFWVAEVVRFVDVEGVAPLNLGETNPLVVPIPLEAQSAKKFTLEIEARQDLTASVVTGTGPLRVVLPLLEATNPSRANVVVSPATVTMIAADNILLTPRPQQLKALAPLFGSPAGVLPDADGAAAERAPDAKESDAWDQASGVRYRYRDRGSTEQAVFVGDIKIQPQMITARVTTAVTLTRASASVEQRLAYMVLHEPVESLSFAYGERLAGDARFGLRLFLQDQPLVPTLEPATVSERARMWVRLPRPLSGPFELRVVHARQAMPDIAPDTAATIPLALLVPATRGETNTSIVENTLTVVHEDAFRVEPANAAWTPVEHESSRGRTVLMAASEGADPALRVALRGAQSVGNTVLQQYWIQSWFSGPQRRDRVVFRVQSTEPTVRVLLPPMDGGQVRPVQLAVDQQEVVLPPESRPGEVIVPLPVDVDGGPREHVVELWYIGSSAGAAPGGRTLEAATVDAVDRAEQAFWQIVLPRSEVVVRRDSRASSELRWQWDGFGWRRHAAREQADLEAWTEASRQDAPPGSTNRYVFTTWGAPRQLVLTTAYRSWLLLAASGGIFLVGLLLMYVPWLRHPAVLFAMALATGTLSAAYPEAAILVAQAAVLGVLMAVLAQGCRSGLAARARVPRGARAARPVSDSQVQGGGVRMPRAEGSSRIAPTAVPLPLQIPATDSKS
jgi:hypothetical protein